MAQAQPDLDSPDLPTSAEGAASAGAVAGSGLAVDSNTAGITIAGPKKKRPRVFYYAALGWLSAYPQLTGGPVALLTNAGFESVNGSDLLGARWPTATLRAAAQQSLDEMLTRHKLAGLVTARLPLDLTPMAGETVFLDAAEILIADAAVLVIGLVPFTRRLDTSAAGGAKLAVVLAHLSHTHHKPIAVAIDAGTDYTEYRRAFRDAGLPIFDRVETALRGLRILG